MPGKTYTLCRYGSDSSQWYLDVNGILDALLDRTQDPLHLLAMRRKSSRKLIHANIRTVLSRDQEGILGEYLEDVDSHLRSLRFWQRFTGVIGANRRQYLMYMLEVILVNRLNAENFRAGDYKLALLPHCLRDFNENCKAVSDGKDYRCRHCSSSCFIEKAGALMRDASFDVYIWRTLDLKKLLKEKMMEGKKPVVLGIACLPELVMGMRRMGRYNLPVVGIPLDANKCRRWQGFTEENSFNTGELMRLLGPIQD